MSLPQKMRHINIRVLYKEMAKVSLVLDGANCMLEDALSKAARL